MKSGVGKEQGGSKTRWIEFTSNPQSQMPGGWPFWRVVSARIPAQCVCDLSLTNESEPFLLKTTVERVMQNLFLLGQVMRDMWQPENLIAVPCSCGVLGGQLWRGCCSLCATTTCAL